jgi:RNA polymerase sigma-70 factor (ECF subfamily)
MRRAFAFDNGGSSMTEQGHRIGNDSISRRSFLAEQIEGERDPAAQTWEQKKGELQDAISRCLPSLHRRAYRYLGNSHDAEDAVQDALLSAYKHLDQFKGNAKMTTWLTSIVTNSALTQMRRRPRQPHSSLDEPITEGQSGRASDRLADVRPSPEDECIMSEFHGHLTQFIEDLSPSLQTAIQMHHFDGITTSKAALILGIPEGTIKARVRRARLKLKERSNLAPKRTAVAAMTHDLHAFRGRHELAVQ